MRIEEYLPLAHRTEKMPGGISDQDLFNFRLNHACLGLLTELGELFEEDCDQEEEFGDFLWYMAVACNTLDVVPVLGDFPKRMPPATSTLISATGQFADYVKKHVIYGQEFNRIGAQLELSMMLTSIYEISFGGAWSVEGAMMRNINKLRRRYPDKYTDEHAAARADKRVEPAYLLAGGEVRDMTVEK